MSLTSDLSLTLVSLLYSNNHLIRKMSNFCNPCAVKGNRSRKIMQITEMFVSFMEWKNYPETAL